MLNNSHQLKIRLILLLIVLISINCNKDLGINHKNADNSKTYFISQECASHVAQFLDIKNPRLNSINSVLDTFQNLISRTISSTYTVADTNNIPAFYVFNYIDNGGWLILSADARIQPILAYNFEGSFEQDSNINSGLALWLDATIESIELVRDSLYDNGDKGINAWYELINDYTLSSELENYLPPSLEGGSNAIYCPTVYVQKGPLLKTTWGQGCTYNDNLSSSCSKGWQCYKFYTGCVATATSQIMKYHNSPSSSFNFSSMSNPNGNSHVQSLMKTVGTDVNMNYGCDGSSATMSDSKDALKNTYGYSFAYYGNFNYQQILTDINNYSPLMLSGCHTRTNNRKKWWYYWKPKYNYSECHQWVCDGVTYLNDCGNYIVGLVHMNWGWHEVDPSTLVSKNQDFNGWYSVFDWVVPNGRNFQYATKMVYQIEP